MGYFQEDTTSELIRESEDDCDDMSPAERNEVIIESLTATVDSLLSILEAVRPLVPFSQWPRLDRVIAQSKQILECAG